MKAATLPGGGAGVTGVSAQDFALATLAEIGTTQLMRLGEALDFSTADTQPLVDIFTRLLGTAASRSAIDPPTYHSDVVDDHTPFEMSIAIGDGAPELRVLVEPVDGDPSLSGRWRAARAAGEWLRAEHGADLTRLDRVADLFEPRHEHALLASWYAVGIRKGGRPDVKAYFDLRARGGEHAVQLLEAALARLELAAAYPRVLRDAARRGPALDELVYFSLDLTGREGARVKVYLRHHHASAEDAERVVGRIGGVEAGDVRAFCDTILGGSGPYFARPLVSCWSFARGVEPSGATLYAPIAYYVNDDGEAAERIRRWLAPHPDTCSLYDRALSAFARRPLDRGVGMHSYVSFKRDRGTPRSTVYFAPEVYSVFAPGTLAKRMLPAPVRSRSPLELVRRLETVERLTDHPLFRRLAREEPKVRPLWAILANNWVGVGEHFPHWLSGLHDRVTHPGIKQVLAKQLHDERGGGDPSQAHRELFQKMLADLEPYAPPGDRERWLGPGRWFAKRLAEHYLERPVLESVGASLVAEVYGKQVDQAIGDLLRRQTELDVSKLTWLVLHEELEEEHADESAQIARMAPQDPDSRAAMCRGIEALALDGFRYLDRIYEVLFGDGSEHLEGAP